MEAYRKAQPAIDIAHEAEPPANRSAASSQSLRQDGQPQKARTEKHERLRGLLPTDTCRVEGAVNVKNYVTILEDLLLRLQINVAVARGFKDLEFPQPKDSNTKTYIDLWPIQMSAQIAAEGGDSILTTNFDTYTLILQLGCILNTVPAWKKAYDLRVIVFVEYEIDVEEERSRVKTLLDNLRIQAEILVFWLAAGDLKTYQVIINGDYSQGAEKSVDEALKDEDWWQDVQKLRGRRARDVASEQLADAQGLLDVLPNWPSSSFQQGRGKSPARRFENLRRLISKSKGRRSSGDLNGLGVRQSMQTHRLHKDVMEPHASYASASEESESEDTTPESFEDDSADSLNKASLASENDIDDLEEDFGNDYPRGQSPSRTMPRRGLRDSSKAPSRQRPSLKFKGGDRPRLKVPEDRDISTPSDTDETPQTLQSSRPRSVRRSSAAKFSSRPQPRITVSTEDGPGPSIIFNDSRGTPPKNSPSIYTHPSAAPAPEPAPATGFPSSQSTPLSFNDLPCRAQHLILNELMQQHSKDTAVLFTTLPSPVEGTCENEEDCVSYLSDLEVLWSGLPPVLMIHSNSMTVTMNL